MYVFVCIPRSLSVSRELTVPCQYTKFQNPSGKVNMEEKHSETCMHTSFFKREPRTDSTLPIHRISKAISENTHGGEMEETCMFTAYCSLRNEMARNEMERNEMGRNEMEICSLRNENL